jgi:hypothetical protein
LKIVLRGTQILANWQDVRRPRNYLLPDGIIEDIQEGILMAVVRTAVMMAVFSLAGGSSVIIDTFGPGDSFQPPPGEVIGGGILRDDPPPNQGVTQAFKFMPVVPTFLDNVQLALRYVLVAGRATGPANLDVSIALDNAGAPGAALETVHLVNVLGGVAFAPEVVLVNSELNPLLQAGTSYWLVVAPPDLLNTAFDWLISPRTDLLVPAAERLGMSSWTTFNSTQPLAFRVTGTTEIPEPGSAVLLLGVLLGSFIWRHEEHAIAENCWSVIKHYR